MYLMNDDHEQKLCSFSYTKKDVNILFVYLHSLKRFVYTALTYLISHSYFLSFYVRRSIMFMSNIMCDVV